jgi:hypothetical protein
MQHNQPSTEKSELSDTKQYLINNEKFQLLKQCQQEIYEATETSPAIRKIINELINEESLSKIKTKFIAVWGN